MPKQEEVNLKLQNINQKVKDDVMDDNTEHPKEDEIQVPTTMNDHNNNDNITISKKEECNMSELNEKSKDDPEELNVNKYNSLDKNISI